MTSLVPFLILATHLFNFGSIQAQEGCKEECGDYHRICPAVKDPSMYEDYKLKHESGALGKAWAKSPLPPAPDCNDEFYKTGCPHSCGICTPCEPDDSAALGDLEAKLSAQIEEIGSRPINCDPCTQILGAAATGEPACLPKYLTEWKETAKCSCDCGSGEQTFEKVCYAYEARNNGVCKQVVTASQNCPDEPDTKTEACSPSGPCTVTLISEKTKNKEHADTKNTLRYKAYTAGGQVCNLGVVKKADNNQRNRNSVDNYFQDEIENPVCNNLCMQKNEKFSKIKVTIDGTDGWFDDWIKVTVNGAQKTYKTDAKKLDDKKEETWD